MLLNELSIPASPLPTVVEAIRAQLAQAKDSSTNLLNQSVAIGMDAAYANALEKNLSFEAVPCIRIACPVEGYEMDGGSGIALWQQVTLQFYFLYAVGTERVGTDSTGDFTALRDDHIRWNLAYLRYSPPWTPGMALQANVWKWVDGQHITVDHETPFRYIDSAIHIRPPYTCSRVDMSILVRNWIS